MHFAMQSPTPTKNAGASAPEVIDLLFVVAPHTMLLDVAGPAEAFRLANEHRARLGLPPRFALRFVGPQPQPTSSVGLTLANIAPLPSQLAAPTWVVLAGQPTATVPLTVADNRAVETWLSNTLAPALAAPNGAHRFVGICSGTLLAARAGLLAQRRCTTHHELLGELRALAPTAQVMGNRVFVVDGPVACSAGIAAGIDLALHLITEVCGEALAASVAQDMVVYLRRSPQDPELSPFLEHRRHLNPVVHRIQNAVSSAPEQRWGMAEMAYMGHVTERHLLRLFKEHAGVSPLQYLQSIRLERARQSLERGAQVTQAAEAAGFSSDLQLRRTWTRHWSGSPRDAQRVANRATLTKA